MFKTSLKIAGGAAIAALASVSAVAADGPAARDGSYAGSAIASGEYVEAERMLQPASYADARDPARLINLATVYARTERFGEARAALDRVHQLPDEMLLLADGVSYSSHKVASAMIHRLP